MFHCSTDIDISDSSMLLLETMGFHKKKKNWFKSCYHIPLMLAVVLFLVKQWEENGESLLMKREADLREH